MADYAEFRLRIERGAEPGQYRVEATALGGTATGIFQRPFSDTDLENFILRVGRTRRGVRRIESPEWELAKAFGAKLFAATVTGQVADLYRSASAQARATGEGLRITLALTEAPEVGQIPWEYLYDAPSFLSISAATPVVRYVDLPRPRPALPVDLPIRILGMVSAPSDAEELKTDVERAKLEAALKPLIDAGAVSIEWLEDANLLALVRRMRNDTFHILHYIGHGGFDDASGQGALLLEDEGGRGRIVSGEQLATVLQNLSALRLVFLNSCEGARNAVDDPFSGVATGLIERDVPAVIGMQFEITDRAAVVFASEFYTLLAEGEPVDAAVTGARLAVFADHNDVEWATPVLYMRVADGKLFKIANHGEIARSDPDTLVATAIEAAPALAGTTAAPPVPGPEGPVPGPVEPVPGSGGPVPGPEGPVPGPVDHGDPAGPGDPADHGDPHAGPLDPAGPGRGVVGPTPGPVIPIPGPVDPTPGRWPAIRAWLRAHWRPLAVGAGAIAVLLVAAFIASLGPSNGKIEVTTVSDGIATVFGSDFDANEHVVLSVGDTLDPIVDATADGGGTFTARVPIGDRLSGQVVALGASGVEVRAPFIVTTRRTPDPSSGTPPTPTPGTASTSPITNACLSHAPAPVPRPVTSPGLLFYSYPNGGSGAAKGSPRIYFLAADQLSLGAAAEPVELTVGAFPTWSPDYTRIAFSRGGALYTARFAGGRLGREQPLTNGPNDSFPAWSANGCLAFRRDVVADRGIWVIDPDHMADPDPLFAKPLVPGPAKGSDRSGVDAPDWSPDGLSLVYMRRAGSNYDIEILDLRDGTRQSVLHDAASEQTPKWSPDGTRIAYVLGPSPSNQQDIVVATIQSSDGTVVATPGDPLTDPPGDAGPALRDSNPAWSPDGERLVWYRGDEADHSYRLVTMDVDGGFAGRVQLFGESQSYIDPVWR